MNSVHHLPLVVGRVSPAAKTSQKSTWRFPKMENQPSEKPSIKPGCSHPKRKIHNYKWFKWWYFMDFPLTMPFGVAEFQQTSMVSETGGLHEPKWWLSYVHITQLGGFVSRDIICWDLPPLVDVECPPKFTMFTYYIYMYIYICIYIYMYFFQKYESIF